MTRFDLDRWIAGWRGPALAALVALIAGLPGVFAAPPLDRDESRFVQATTQMLETGDFVDIRFQDQPRHKKPVGIHWMQAATTAVLSSPEARDVWTYRIPSLLGAMLAAAACAWGAAAFWSRRTAVLAGALYGATILLSTEAFIAKTDAMLAGLTTLGLAALGRLYARARGLEVEAGKRTAMIFWAAMAVAVLVKGPVGPLVAATTLIALAVWDRKIGNGWMKSLNWGWGLVLILAVVGPWAFAVTVQTDGAFWGTAVGGDLAPKLVGGHERHGGPPGYHTLLLPVLFYPGTLLLAAAAVYAWTRRAEPGARFAIAWFLPAFLVFELAPTKLPHYPLPTYGALAWLAAAGLGAALTPKTRWTGFGLYLFAAAVISAGAVYLLSEFGDGHAQVWTSLTVGLALIGAFLVGYLLIKKADAAAVLTAGGVGILAHAALFAGLAPSLSPLWIAPRVEQALQSAGLDPRQGFVPGPVAVAGFAEPSLVFLLGTRTELVPDGAGAAAALAAGRAAVVEAEEEPAFRAALAELGVAAEPAGVVTGMNYSKGDPVLLTLWRPAGTGR